MKVKSVSDLVFKDQQQLGVAATMTPEQQMISCPRCGAKIPKNVKCCWGCGKILDHHIIELAKSAKEAKE